MSLVSQRDIGLSDAVADAIYDAFSINVCDLNAQPGANVKTETFLYPYSECSDYEKEIINTHIPFEMYPTELPQDHIYYFAYNSFANHIGLVEDLYKYIQMVKEQTGHDKVNLVPISQGGSIANGLFEYHPEVMDDLHKVLFIVPALDGSIIIGDVFNDRVTFLDSDYLYNGFLEEIRLLDEHTAHLIEILARILPDEIIMESLNKGVKRLVEDVMIRSTSMWALCPSGDYPTAAEKYLSSPEMSEIRKQTDKYYQAQLHSDANIEKLLAKGIPVLCVAEYDFAVINVGERWNTMNGDFIIQLDSTSMGATSANCGETLPDDYFQQNTHCSNPSHNHISPERMVDASTGLLADTTFYYRYQRHDLTRHNNAILQLAMKVIANDDIKDVYSDPDFPQFNFGRDIRELEEPLEIAEGVDTSKLSKADADELNAAVEEAKILIVKPAIEEDEYEKTAGRLNAILEKIGAKDKEKEKDPTFLGKVSSWLFEHYGSDGFSEMPGDTLRNIITKITSIFR